MSARNTRIKVMKENQEHLQARNWPQILFESVTGAYCVAVLSERVVYIATDNDFSASLPAGIAIGALSGICIGSFRARRSA